MKKYVFNQMFFTQIAADSTNISEDDESHNVCYVIDDRKSCADSWVERFFYFILIILV